MINNNQITFPKLFLFSSCFMLLLILGVWQLNKHYYTKIKRVEFSNILEGKATTLKFESTTIKTPAFIEITGLLQESKSIFLEPRTHKGKIGYHKLTPIKLKNRFFLINRGFTKNKTIENVNNKNITIQGIIINIPKKNFLSLENDLKKNKWYTYDVKDLKSYFSQDVEPYIVYEKSNIANGRYFQVIPNIVSDVNHLHYAITWFLVAFSICVIFLISLRESK